MFELSFNSVKKYLDANLILQNVSFNIFDGEKVGIVGINGCGKSTILKLMAGIHTMTKDDKGLVLMPRGATVAYLEQSPSFDGDLKVKEVLNLAFKKADDIELEMRTIENKMNTSVSTEVDSLLKKYAKLQSDFEAIGGYEKAEKLSKVCIGLNFSESFLEKQFDLLSGGEKTTVILGKILLENPDILLLDEPTNHLDIKAVEWLEEYLKAYKGIVVVVSHDRYFLDNVVNKIIEIEDGEATTYKGNYSSFTKQKEENMLIQFEQFKEQQKQIKAMENTIKTLRDWAQRPGAAGEKFFKRAASIQKQLDKIQRIQKPKFDKPNMKLDLKEAERSGNEVIKIKNFSKRFDDKVLFEDSNLLVKFKERAALVGPNGCGKTTLLKVLLGEKTADKGEVVLGASVKYAYLPQNIKFDDEEATVVDTFRKDLFMGEGEARQYLSKFMFYGSAVFRKVKQLSGGERIRLKLSRLLYDDINLLILDEPTNHLDIDSIENLEETLDNFNCTLFFISHDRYFINKIATTIIEADNHKLKKYNGNYDYFKHEKTKLLAAAKEADAQKEKVIKPKQVKQRDPQPKKKNVYKITKLEEKIEELENTLKQIEQDMAENSTNYDKLNDLYKTKTDTESELESAMTEWEELQ